MKKGAGSEEIQYIRNLIQRKKDDLNDTRHLQKKRKNGCGRQLTNARYYLMR